MPVLQGDPRRHDVDLQRVGVVSDLPTATSAIQLGTEGRYKGQPFIVVGRIVYEYDRGRYVTVTDDELKALRIQGVV